MRMQLGSQYISLIDQIGEQLVFGVTTIVIIKFNAN